MQALGLSWDEVTQMPARAGVALRVLLAAKGRAEETQARWAKRDASRAKTRRR